jgi:hypothetical protein
VTTGRLPLGRKVIDLAGEPAPYLTSAERAELLRACPPPYDRTLDAIIGLGYRTGRCWARIDVLAERARLSRRSIYVHRAWLVEHGFLIAQGGGHKGATARFLIARPSDQREATPPPAWARIADPELRAEALRMDL